MALLRAAELSVGQRFTTTLTQRSGKRLGSDPAAPRQGLVGLPMPDGVEVVLMAGPTKMTKFEIKGLHEEVLIEGEKE